MGKPETMGEIPACLQCRVGAAIGATDPRMYSSYAVGNAEVCDDCALASLRFSAIPGVKRLSGQLEEAKKLLRRVLEDDCRIADMIYEFLDEDDIN